MRSIMKCPHRIFRRDYLVMEGTGKTGALSFAIVLAIAPVRAFS
jgi:hypothetical protein